MSRTPPELAADQAIRTPRLDTAPSPTKASSIRLGGFVIHGGDASTLGECLDDLIAVCDEVVAVLSRSGDEARAAVRERGARLVERTWEGYGSSRETAVEALRGCDYVFFLDADERLASGSMEALRAWRASHPSAPHYALPVRDWASLRERPFLFRTEHHVRLVRADAARWTRSMIVHEALPREAVVRLAAPIDHRFATSVGARAAKCETYALLWALRYADSRRRAKPAWLQRAFHVARDCIVKGALFRGGLDAVRLAWAVSAYHARKHEFLRRIRAGEHNELLAAVRACDYAALFRRLELHQT